MTVRASMTFAKRLHEGAISPEDTGFGFVTDSPAEAVRKIVESQPAEVLARLAAAASAAREA